jgi:TRAP-type mannitol/chloroaromatic compound transport system substrate-binding protein
MSWLKNGGGDALYDRLYTEVLKTNIKAFMIQPMGPDPFGWFKKPIKSIEEMKSMKYRSPPGLTAEIFREMGITTVAMPGAEIVPAAQRGVIDAAEWIGPYDDLKLGFNKVAPFYYYPGWWEGGPQLDLFVNNKAYDALSAEHKAILEAATTVAHVNIQARYDSHNPAALKQLVGSGTKLKAFPKDVMNFAYKQAMGLYEEIASKNENWKKVYTEWLKFRSEQNLWFRFTEAEFDRFMQAQKM